MNINIICIGKLKEKYWSGAQEEYVKRIRGFANVSIVELKECKLPKNASRKDEEKVIFEEGKSILLRLRDTDYVIAMDIGGEMLDSIEFSKKITDIFALGVQNVDFIIGGSLGLSDEVKKRADYRLSFSNMTFPHQLARIMLLEQIYRAFKIANGEIYHK